MIPNPDAIHDQKNLLLLMILDTLSRYTDDENPMTREALRRKIEDNYGFKPARNTLYTNLDALITAGFPIITTTRSVYYNGRELKDGEIRFLADSVLYSDFVTKNSAEGILTALGNLGSKKLKKYINGQKARLRFTRKGKDKNYYLMIEDVQHAIAEKKQISFNYLQFCEDLQMHPMYDEPLTVNPYHMVYKAGRYYLIGSEDGSEQVTFWRIDRMTDRQILKIKRTESEEIKEIMRSGDISKYMEAQPELRGGRVETFRLRCAKPMLSEVYDAFGDDIRIAPDQPDTYDPEIIDVIVHATVESMRTWLYSHLDSVVLISPQDIQQEIMQQLERAQSMYRFTVRDAEQKQDKSEAAERRRRFRERSPLFAMMRIGNTASSFAHAIECSNNSHYIAYRGKKVRSLEIADISLLINHAKPVGLSLNNCKLVNLDQLKTFENMGSLELFGCELNAEEFGELPRMRTLKTDMSQEEITAAVSGMTNLKTMLINNSDISDLSFMSSLPNLERLILRNCSQLTDCSGLMYAKSLKEFAVQCPSVTDISAVSSLPNLKSMMVEINQEQADYTFLQRMQHLEELTIYSKQFSYADAEQLQEHLPECEISVYGNQDHERFHYHTPKREEPDT